MEEITKEAVHRLVEAKKKEKRDNLTEIEACNRRADQLTARNTVIDAEIAALVKDVPVPTVKTVMEMTEI